jgi:signal transduction histidine kinase
MTTATDAIAFWQAFRENDRELRLRHARVGCILALVLMPAGSTLELMVYPHLFWPFFQFRWITDLFIAAVFLLLMHPLGKQHVRWLGSAWVFAPAVAISWMIAASEGSASPYYAGLNLVIIIGCLLMPYTLFEAAAVCAIVFLMYLTAVLVHKDSDIWTATFYNNIYFIILTAIIAVASCHYYHRRRVEDFRLRHELDARNRQLAELDRLKSEFFANISHELRTPLTLILGPIENLLLHPDQVPPHALEPLQLVRQNTLRLLNMINDLLEMVRLDARRGEMTRPHANERIHLDSLVPGIVESVRHLAASKRIDLQLERDGDDLVMHGDTSGLERVFLNLLTNALKFTPAGGRITVRLRRDDDHARIEVADTGIGIPPEHLPRIFDRFRQVDGSATRRFRGLGLGLALVKELVDDHHGSLAVQSQVGQGTTFTVRLPLHLSDPAAAASASEPTEAAHPQAAASALASARLESDPTVRTMEAADKIRVEAIDDLAALEDAGSGEHQILVVDDEPDMRRFLVSILAEKFQVKAAGDGETGLEKALEHRPDLIVLDMMLPGLDGLEVCRRVRADRAMDDTRILMLTARADDQTKLAALRCGADDFLTKPFSSLEVRTRIENLLRTQALQRDLRKNNEDLRHTIGELNATRDRLIQSEKMNSLGSLAAGLLHEINNPLNYALTALQLLDDDRVERDESLKETLADVGDGMNRIRDIITDLRTFAYPEQSGNRALIRFADVAETALRFTSHQCEGVQVRREFDANLKVCGSQSQLTQVLVNLLSNAARAARAVADRREPRIDIVAGQNTDRATIVIRDNGVGIDAAAIGRVFDPFYTTQDVGQGLGLGLSVCHTIIRNHGGRMAVRSEKDRWTEVEIDLPAQPLEVPTRHVQYQ